MQLLCSALKRLFKFAYLRVPCFSRLETLTSSLESRVSSCKDGIETVNLLWAELNFAQLNFGKTMYCYLFLEVIQLFLVLLMHWIILDIFPNYLENGIHGCFGTYYTTDINW